MTNHLVHPGAPSNGHLVPKREEIKRFLTLVTREWEILEVPVELEIRLIKERQCQHRRFGVDDIDAATEWAAEQNEFGWNAHYVVNPIDASHVGAARANAIVASRYVFIDTDTPEALARIEVSALTPSIEMTTGTVPYRRVHQYFEIAGGMIEIADWSPLMAGAIGHFESDPATKDAARAMRVAGTISWPNKKKQARGYIPELTTVFVTDATYNVADLRDAFGAVPEDTAPRHKTSNDHPHRHDAEHGIVLDALSSIPGEDTYSEWVRIGMALHAAVRGSAEGYRAFVAWSARSRKFDARHCEQKWREWDRKPADHLSGGTIIYLARQNGWQGSRQAKANGAATLADVEAAKAILWAKPEPLISDAEPPPPYPIEALPDLMRHAVEEVQRFVQAPEEMVAASAISTLSIAAQHLVDVRRTTALQGPNGLYYLIIADSGDRKTTLDRFFMTPICTYERLEREKGKATKANHAAKMAVWEAEKQAVTAKPEGAAKSGKALEGHQADLAELEKNKPTPPRIPRLLYADATQEKLLRSLATGWPSAAIVSSEGGAVFGAHAMGHDSVMRTLSAFNLLWDGGTLQVDRVGSESFVVQGVRLSINLQVQPAVLRDFMEGTKGLARGSGFLARFLLAAPETRQGTRMFREAPVTWPALTAFNARISALLNTAANTNDDGTLSPTVLDFSHEAKAAWIECHDEIEKAIGPTGEFVDVRDVAAKAADNIARMAALFHILEERNGYSLIGAAAVRSAAAVVIWHLYAAKYFLGPLASSPEETRAAALDGWLRVHCRREGVTSVSTRTVQRYGPIRDRKPLHEALDALAEASRVKVVVDGKKRLVAINPALLEANP
jgi:Protein of unknown function (DUF3987)/Primase C terminal 2 (PriCT-2)